MTTPVEIAKELGVQPIDVRRYLRREHPRSDAEKGQRWQLSDDTAAAVREHFRSRSSS